MNKLADQYNGNGKKGAGDSSDDLLQKMGPYPSHSLRHTHSTDTMTTTMTTDTTTMMMTVHDRGIDDNDDDDDYDDDDNDYDGYNDTSYKND